MMQESDYKFGIAFICEGATEKYFYINLLEYYSQKFHHISITRIEDSVLNDIYYEIISKEFKILIKFNNVGTITQIKNSYIWFQNKCLKMHKIPWHVFLCYDTDEYCENITKFYEGDWKNLRKQLSSKWVRSINDLAASADIEDIMLTDISGVCSFLGISVPEIIKGRKGKAKMKFLFRSVNATYHEGERAVPLIKSLNFDVITSNTQINYRGLANLINSI